MHCISTRSLAALAYERGEEFDPALMPTPDLIDDLGTAMGAVPVLGEPGSYERRRLRERERRARARVPDWFSADDLVPDGIAVIHGEPVSDGPAGEYRGADEPRAGDARADRQRQRRPGPAQLTGGRPCCRPRRSARRAGAALDEWRRAGGFDPYG